tara:strand:+ start:19898 stop:20353 length:456 start_codon:yes stop_codon:yes gene_type:complete
MIINSTDLSHNHKYLGAKNKPSESMQAFGSHFMLELYDCNSDKLNDEAFIRNIINLSIKESGARLLNLVTHSFQPQGVTALALLAESHLSIHTWPESLYAAIDVFTCGSNTNPSKACDLLISELEAKSHHVQMINRYAPFSINKSLRKERV